MKITEAQLALLYANLRALRIHKGEKISSMAVKLDLKDLSIYHKFESGHRTKLDLIFFTRVCHILEVCPQYMLYISGIDLCAAQWLHANLGSFCGTTANRHGFTPPRSTLQTSMIMKLNSSRLAA
jgi:hypothetical protein